MSEKIPEKYYVDFRFIVENAKDVRDAAGRAEALINEATENVWYTIDKVTRLQKNMKRKEADLYQACEVKYGDPRK